MASRDELEITTRRTDGRLPGFTPIWMVTHDGSVFVRTWHRRDTGWYGRAVRAGDARIRLDDVETDVSVDDVGAGDSAGTLRRDIDDAYRRKYSRYGDATVSRMVGDDAAASTLRLTPTG